MLWSRWLKQASSAQERAERERLDFLTYRDSAGRVFDFHSLRHTTGSLLAASGVHPKTAQAIMRHSTIGLTMDRHTHSLRHAERDAVAALPHFDATDN
jgi:integrase